MFYIIFFIIFIILFFLFIGNKKRNFKTWFTIFTVGTIIILWLVISFSHRESSSLFYPEIDEKVLVKEDLEFTNSKYSPNSIYFLNQKKRLGISQRDNKDYINKNYKKFLLKEGDSFLIKQKVITGYPDFSVRYAYQIVFSDKNLEKEFLSEAKKYPYLNTNKIPEWYSWDKVYLSKETFDEFSDSFNFNWNENTFSLHDETYAIGLYFIIALIMHALPYIIPFLIILFLSLFGLSFVIKMINKKPEVLVEKDKVIKIDRIKK